MPLGRRLHCAPGGRRLRFVLLLAVLALVAATSRAAAAIVHGALRTVHEINALNNADASHGYPVELEGIVTYSDPEWGLLFMEDSTGAIYVNVHGVGTAFEAGSRIRVQAITAQGDVAPTLTGAKVRILGAGSLPRAKPLSLAAMDGGAGDSSYVLTEGVLRPGDRSCNRICFLLFDGAVSVLVVIPQSNSEEAQRLVGARVRVRGVVGSRMDAAGKRVGAQLFVPRLTNIEVESSSSRDVEGSAPQPIGTLRDDSADGRFVRRVHVQGTVIWERPGIFFADDGTGAVCVRASKDARVQQGSKQEIFGFPARGEPGLTLSDATVRAIRGTAQTSLVSPIRATAAGILEHFLNHKQVRVRARLIEQTTTSNEHVFRLEDGDQQFRANLPGTASAEEFVRLPRNAVLELTGISVIRKATGERPESLLILMRSPSDVVVVAGNSWLSLKWVMSFFGGVVFLAIATMVWISQLRRTVRGQTATIRARLEREMLLETQYKRLFERNLAGVFRWRPDGTILDCNAAFARMLGFQTSGELIGRSYWQHQVDSGEQQQLRDALAGAGLSNRDANLRRVDGELVCMLENITAVETAEGTLYETTAIDVTQLRQNQADLQRAKDAAVHQSLNDALTGLPNRRLLTDRMTHMLAAARREKHEVALLYIDLDGFKLVNDSLGHAIGDALLIHVAARLQARVRESDTLARLGGDEFIVVLAGLQSSYEAARVAEDLIRILTEPFNIEDHEVLIGASIGLSVYPRDGEQIPDLLQQADSAMYAAKREGRNRALFFTAELGSALRERLNLEHQLRGAVGRNEISVCYQPEFDTMSGKLTRFEALARWTHPTLGAIPPDKFIPIAEESGLIVLLGAYILEQACAEAAKWQSSSQDPIQLAVNVSSIQFLRESFADEVIEVVGRTGFPPHLLQLELTESVMMTGNHLSTETMRRLRAVGISLAIDDFGTGYSCLTSLQSSSFDCLKIDRSFIKDLGVKAGGEAMVNSVVSLAHSLGMRVIVEGIENVEQLEVIRRLGGDEVQGYLMGRPTVDPRAVIMSTRDVPQLALA